MTRFHHLLAAFALLAAPACGGDDDGNSDDGDNPGTDGGGEDDVDSGPDEDGFVELLTVDWSLPPPSGPTPDEYWCARLTVDEDMLIAGFRAISPIGTHHTVLSVGGPGGADGEFPCEFFENHDTLLFASGVGTDDFLFPEGVAMPVTAGQQLFLNVHLFNTGSNTLEGVSGVSVLKVDEADTLAEFTFAGTFDIDIAADDPDAQASGGCTLDQDATILNWWPHMHQLGEHMLVEINGEPVHDQMFRFEEQTNYPTNIEVSDGDEITVTCSYLTSDVDVTFGDSSNQEMCFAGFYRFPATGDAFCASGIPGL
jgi:hypothetical protein